MPSTTIETKSDLSDEHVAHLIEAVFQAQVQALGVPDDYRNVRYLPHRPAYFVGPPTKDNKYIHIEIALFTGRSAETKQALLASTVSNLAALGHPSKDISIVLHEQPDENWYYGA